MTRTRYFSPYELIKLALLGFIGYLVLQAIGYEISWRWFRRDLQKLMEVYHRG